MTSFKDLGLNTWLLDTCREMGIKEPTEIQKQCIPAVLKGLDVVGRAKTGSGKTAAFALPILHTLSQDPFGIYALILTPTRELAFQITVQFSALGTPIPLTITTVVGGLDMLHQNLEISKRPHIIVATPGRLADHIKSGLKMSINNLQYLILDEADRLFDSCFDKDMDTILSTIPPPENRQTLLFSATMTYMDKISKVTKKKPEPLFLQVSDSQHSTVEDLEQTYLYIPQNAKEVYLYHILTQSQYENSSIIIFTSTCKSCEIIGQYLIEMELECVTLNSRLTQSRRLASLGKFRSGKARILVATDVASRGLDIPTVQLVINFDIPRVIDDYIHRVGRTARAGRGGIAITIVSQYDVDIFKQIEKFLNMELKLYQIKQEKVLEIFKKCNQARRMAKIRLEEYEFSSNKLKRYNKVKKDEEDGKDSGQEEQKEKKQLSSSEAGTKKLNLKRKEKAVDKPKKKGHRRKK